MTAEKYVNRIVRKVKCSGSKRGEIRRQLLSDISAERENGAALEDIMKRMGEPREVAAEFNQNLSDEERRLYKRGCILKIAAGVAVILLVAVVLVRWMAPSVHPVEGTFDQTAVEEQAKRVVELLDANDFDTLRSESIEAMQQSLTREVIDSARVQVSSDWGAFRQFGQIYMTQVDQKGVSLVVVELTAAYENTNITYTITFDENMKLAGLYMK